MSEKCGCEYPVGCGDRRNWPQECRYAFDLPDIMLNISVIESECNLKCPDECNLVSFPINRVDVEGDIPDWMLDSYKGRILGKFVDISEISDQEFKKRFTELKIYFSRIETTEITQSPSMTPTNLVGNVGGLSGKTKRFI